MTAAPHRPIRTLLVANRGEIARRVIAAARGLGLRTVAVVGRADEGAAFAAEADLAVSIGDEADGVPYLDGAKILDAARRAGADAIHPGYGFLSERAEFAQAVVDAGLCFVGPTPSVMAAMADKDAAKAAARAAGVPVVPGVEGRGLSLPALAALVVAEVGFPCLIKAAAGGGGRGMRRVDAEAALLPALELAASEAARSFGDGTLLVERYIARGRHVEVQILADGAGNVLHLHERDCSVQRRHQKLIEEAPAPSLNPALRAQLHDDAVRLARQIGYTSAGTFEFLVDVERGSHHFLEVNARVQVEHPVSELLTGVDVVRWQLRVAMGEALPFGQADIAPRGAAIEVRLCAEDAAADFAPQAGAVHALWIDAGASTPPLRFELPPQGAAGKSWQMAGDGRTVPAPPGTERGGASSDLDGRSWLRVDGAWDCGVAPPGDAIGVVPVHYDSMIAKIIAWAPTRPLALSRLRRALADSALCGVSSNLPWLQAALAHPTMEAGEATTAFVAEAGIAIQAPAADDLDDEALLAAALWLHEAGLRRRFRSNGHRPDVTVFHLRDDPSTAIQVALLARADGGFDGAVDRAPDPHLLRPRPLTRSVRVRGRDGTGLQLEVDGLRRKHWLVGDGEALWVQVPGRGVACLQEGTLLPWPRAAAAEKGALQARSPALVVAVHVSVGDAVAAGAPLVTLEAMKMLTVVRAEGPGVVAGVDVVVGQGVAAGAALVRIVDAAETSSPSP